jgi:SAM-dependent methyltransferase
VRDGSYTGTDNLLAMTLARNYNEFLVQAVLRHSGGAGVVVDFGAGAGTFARKLREHGLNVICIELDSALRDGLRSDGFECYADIEQLPEAGVDYIFSLNVFEHIEDDTAMFNTLCQRLRPGGRFYLYVPAFPILYTSMDRKVGHFRRYRAGKLRKQLEQSGFEVHSARYADSLGFFVTLLYKLFGSREGDLNSGSVKLYDRFIFPISRLLDMFAGRVLGKNVAVSAVRPAKTWTETSIPISNVQKNSYTDRSAVA